MPDPTTAEPKLLVKLGIAAGAAAAVGALIVWPMYQVTQGRVHVWVSFKGMIFAAFLAGGAVNTLLPPGVAIPWKKSPQDQLSPLQKIVVWAIAGGALLTVGLVWYFFRSHGYSIGF